MRYLLGFLIATTLYYAADSSIDDVNSSGPIKSALIKNMTSTAVEISYRSNDPGFSGSHVIVPQKKILEGAEETVIRAYGPSTEAGAKAMVTFSHQSIPDIQAPISIRNREIIRITALASGFYICNEDETRQYFFWHPYTQPPTIEALH